ncbi:alpha-(1,3)-fucosyltransferase C-like isoform X2 [Artemia franciscana]|uniref:alpha-(1,3)-fucosyltransferase C-like isoform X2 n=1 Tax=Artemia franciscana TaxID=6661 RepID=UPI0032DAEB6A
MIIYGQSAFRENNLLWSIVVIYELLVWKPAKSFMRGEDSDIFVPYGAIKRREKRVIREYKNFTKKNLVAWMVSRCETAGRREDYIEELNEYIQVDVYGRCGNNKCPKEHWKECYDMIQNNYKFYLSFENSLCKDYVTEKLFNILQYDVIPVVYGSADYNRILPPYSYINALDNSPSELANLLKDIGNDAIKYQRYFNWKEEYDLHVYDNSLFVKHAFCQLCKKLHTDTEKKFYGNFNKWWIDGSKCTKDPIIQKAQVLHFWKWNRNGTVT